MDPVGRVWYVKLTRGQLRGEVEIGTSHLLSGRTVWYRAPWDCPVDPMSEKDVGDELYVALMAFLEQKG
jgi:hypothetical protein